MRRKNSLSKEFNFDQPTIYKKKYQYTINKIYSS